MKSSMMTFDEAADAAAAAAAAKAAEDARAAEEAAAAAKAAEKKFSQADMDSKIQERLAAQQKTVRTLNEEIEALRSKTSLTTAEKEEMETKISELNRSLLTKEELTAQDKKKAEKKFNEELETERRQKNYYKDLYETETVNRSLMDSAVGSDAINPEHIVDILRPNTRLVEVKNDEGKGTGKYESRVDYTDHEAEGGPKKLDLTVAEAVKMMSESERHFNLFKGDGVGGLGSGNFRKAGGNPTINVRKLATNPKAYREAREKGKVENI